MFVYRLDGLAIQVNPVGRAHEGAQVGNPSGVLGEQLGQEPVIGFPSEGGEEVLTDADLERAQRARVFRKGRGKACPQGRLQMFP